MRDGINENVVDLNQSSAEKKEEQERQREELAEIRVQEALKGLDVAHGYHSEQGINSAVIPTFVAAASLGVAYNERSNISFGAAATSVAMAAKSIIHVKESKNEKEGIEEVKKWAAERVAESRNDEGPDQGGLRKRSAKLEHVERRIVPELKKQRRIIRKRSQDMIGRAIPMVAPILTLAAKPEDLPQAVFFIGKDVEQFRRDQIQNRDDDKVVKEIDNHLRAIDQNSLASSTVSSNRYSSFSDGKSHSSASDRGKGKSVCERICSIL